MDKSTPRLTTDDGPADVTLRQFAESGIDIDALAAQLQEDGAKSFVKSWENLIDVISSKVQRIKEGRLVELLNTFTLRFVVHEPVTGGHRG